MQTGTGTSGERGKNTKGTAASLLEPAAGGGSRCCAVTFCFAVILIFSSLAEKLKYLQSKWREDERTSVPLLCTQGVLRTAVGGGFLVCLFFFRFPSLTLMSLGSSKIPA